MSIHTWEQPYENLNFNGLCKLYMCRKFDPKIVDVVQMKKRE